MKASLLINFKTIVKRIIVVFSKKNMIFGIVRISIRILIIIKNRFYSFHLYSLTKESRVYALVNVIS